MIGALDTRQIDDLKRLLDRRWAEEIAQSRSATNPMISIKHAGVAAGLAEAKALLIEIAYEL